MSFQKLKKLQQNDKINLLELKESYKQNVTIIDNDTDKKLLLIECDNRQESLCYSQIKSISCK